MKNLLSTTRLAVAATLLAACGGGPITSGQGSGGPDEEAPKAEITFPPAVSLTDASILSVRGTTTHLTPVESVRVNGTRASTDDLFDHWIATIALDQGSNDITVATRDFRGFQNGSAATAKIRSIAVLAQPEFLALDPSRSLLYVSDAGLAAVVSIDRANGAMSVASGATAGSGTPLRSPAGIAFDPDGQRLLLVDRALPGVLTIDPFNGARVILSDVAVGSGPAFGNPGDLELDSAHGRALVVDANLDALIAVDLATGDRTVISDATTGSGAPFTSPGSVALDAARGRALVGDQASGDAGGSIVAVDLASGARSTLVSGLGAVSGLVVDPDRDVVYVSDPSEPGILRVALGTGALTPVSSSEVGSGIGLFRPAGLDLEKSTGLVLVAEELAVVLSVDRDTGERKVASTDATGGGPILGLALSVAIDATGNRALAASTNPASVTAIDLASGDRTDLTGASAPAGLTLEKPVAVAIGSNDLRAVVADANLVALVSIDLTSLARTIVSDATTGAGQAFGVLAGVAVDDLANLAYVTDTTLKGVITVDLATGNRTVLSADGVGAGPSFDTPDAAVLDSAGNRLLVTDDGLGAIVSVDLSSGERKTIASADLGGGGPLEPRALALDPADATHAFVVSASGRQVLSLDLTTGDRSVLSSSAVGTGPAFEVPSSIAVDTAHGTVVVADPNAHAVFDIAPDDGERVILSR